MRWALPQSPAGNVVPFPLSPLRSEEESLSGESERQPGTAFYTGRIKQ